MAPQFHSMVAKLLFLAKRGRPDVLLAVSFLTMWVKLPDEDDWKKLMRVLGWMSVSLQLHEDDSAFSNYAFTQTPGIHSKHTNANIN